MKHLKTYENNKGEFEFDWKKFKDYVNTYDPKYHANNDYKIIIEDMLYGIGISVDGKFKWPKGYKKFKDFIEKYEIKKQLDKYRL